MEQNAKTFRENFVNFGYADATWLKKGFSVIQQARAIRSSTSLTIPHVSSLVGPFSSLSLRPLNQMPLDRICRQPIVASLDVPCCED